MSPGLDSVKWLTENGYLTGFVRTLGEEIGNRLSKAVEAAAIKQREQAWDLAKRQQPAAPRICSFMANGRMTLVRADQVVRLDDLGDGKTAMLLVGSNSSFPILVDGDLSEVARKIWGDAWSAGAASEGGAS